MKEICNLKRLKSLKISNYDRQLDSEIIKNLADNCEDLEHIFIGGENLYSKPAKTRMAWNYFLGQRSQHLKTFHLDMSLICRPRVSLDNLKLCRNLEELSLNTDYKDLKMLPYLPALKKLVLIGIPCGHKDMIKCFKSLDLSNLKYLSFRHNVIIGENVFLESLAKISFPVLERLYYHPDDISDITIKEKTLQTLLKNTPKLKSIQFSGQIANDLTNEFLFDIFKKSNVFVLVGDSVSQIELENFFKQSDSVQSEKYQIMKAEVLKWWYENPTKVL